MLDIGPVASIASSKTDLSFFRDEVKDSMGFALPLAQRGGKHRAF